MNDFKEKYDNLIKRGYSIDFYEEDRDFPITGKYKAYCVSIKKNDKEVLKHFSKESTEHALVNAYELIKFSEEHGLII